MTIGTIVYALAASTFVGALGWAAMTYLRTERDAGVRSE